MPDIPAVPCSQPSAFEEPDSIRKEYVHLGRSDMVLLTSWRRTEDGEFSLSAKWPAPGSGLSYDPRMLTQTVRQSGLVIAHAAYGAPLDDHTLLNYFDLTVTPGFEVPPGLPCDFTVEVTVKNAKKRGKKVSSLDMEFRILRDGDLTARADSEFGWLSTRVYQRLRGEHLAFEWNSWPLPAPVDPRTVGRHTPADVVLAAGKHALHWQLRNDVDNVVLYDHPVDHVPGLALMEAADQAARAAVYPAPFEATTVTSTFERYTELDRPCWVEAEILPAGPGEASVLVTATQDGNTAFRSRLSGPCGQDLPGLTG